MKKKFLSLLMATAMVAGASVQAFAATSQTVNGNSTQTLDAPVKVTGTVSKSDGTVPTGKIEVELPTALSFAVDQDSNVTAANFTIANKSAEKIKVKVGSFRETKANAGITLVNSADDLTGKDRAHVHLTLRSQAGNVVTLVDNMGEEELQDIDAHQSANIQVLGTAGTTKKSAEQNHVDDTGANEEFDLVFKISKAN